MTKDNYLRDENNENEPTSVLAVPREKHERPKLTKADQERFLRRKEEVDRKIKEQREKLAKEYNKGDL